GYQRDYPDEIVAGIIVVLVLALIVDRLLYLLGRWATPWLNTGRRTLTRRVRLSVDLAKGADA
ncbi:ABC transporter permease, partial [Nocardia gipuzkoensis]